MPKKSDRFARQLAPPWPKLWNRHWFLVKTFESWKSIKAMFCADSKSGIRSALRSLIWREINLEQAFHFVELVKSLISLIWGRTKRVKFLPFLYNNSFPFFGAKMTFCWEWDKKKVAFPYFEVEFEGDFFGQTMP